MIVFPLSSMHEMHITEIGEGRFDSFPQCPTLAFVYMPAHYMTWSLISWTTSQITSTATQFTSWKMKDGIKATLVEENINKQVRLYDGSAKKIKADRYVLIEWSPKLSLILEIPENHHDYMLPNWVDEINH